MTLYATNLFFSDKHETSVPSLLRQVRPSNLLIIASRPQNLTVPGGGEKFQHQLFRTLQLRWYLKLEAASRRLHSRFTTSHIHTCRGSFLVHSAVLQSIFSTLFCQIERIWAAAEQWNPFFFFFGTLMFYHIFTMIQWVWGQFSVASRNYRITSPV